MQVLTFAAVGGCFFYAVSVSPWLSHRLRRATVADMAKPIRHGTAWGYKRHLQAGEPACQARKDAHTEAHLGYMHRHGAKPKPPLQPYGTRAAYHRHLRRREDVCEACLEANRTRSRRIAAEKRGREATG